MRRFAFALLPILAIAWLAPGAEPAKLEKSWETGHGLKFTVKSAKPQDVECDLQIMGWFEHDPKGDTVVDVIVAFDQAMGRPIKNLTEKGAFTAAPLETILLTPPTGAMKPKQVLLIGYGSKEKMSVDVFKGIAKVAAREAVRLKAKKIAFAPAIIDQGYDKLHAKEVAPVFTRAFLVAYDTEMRLQAEGLAPAFKLEEIYLEAGKTHFDDVIAGAAEGIEQAKADIAKRGNESFRNK